MARSSRTTIAAAGALLATATVVVGVGVTIAAKGGEDSGPLAVEDAWAGPNQGLLAVYLTIDNPGEPDRLVGVSLDGAPVEASFMAGEVDMDHAAEAGGEAEEVDVPIPPGTTELRPGASHLMIEGLPASVGVTAGDGIPLQLRFARAGAIAVPVEILSWDEVAERSG